MPESKPKRLYSGVFECGDCGAEWEFEHARKLRCPECGGDDLVESQGDEEDGKSD